MIRTENVTRQSPDFEKVRELYLRAFPADERIPLRYLLRNDPKKDNFISFYDGAVFCGFASLLSYRDITHLLYFAIDDALRGRGYGTEALRIIREMKPQQRIFADIETEDAASDNNDQRRRRKQFYLRNGYTESGVRYEWLNVSYEILISGGTLTEDDFEDFWHHII